MAMLKKLLKQLNKFRTWRKEKAIDNLLKIAGIDLTPEEGVFGVLSQAEEQIVLERLYDDKLFMALLRKYAEGVNKKMIDDVISANPAQVAEYKGGKEKLFSFFVGEMMKKTKGKANPAIVNTLLKNGLTS